MPAATSLDFGYPWWLSYGHLVFLIPALGGLVTARARRWPWKLTLPLALIAIWAAGALFVMRAINAGDVPSLPTQKFLQSGKGRVLDIGTGTGRSAIMVLRERPEATLVALDLFGSSFEHHFGSGAAPQQRLLANLKAAGVDRRATIETADMRTLPFEAATFDAIVSAYAIDHLGADGARQALAEAGRVMKPGGDFLLMLVANDRWTKLAFGPLLSHGGTRGAGWWTARLQDAGFTVVEQGTSPATIFFLLRRS